MRPTRLITALGATAGLCLALVSGASAAPGQSDVTAQAIAAAKAVPGRVTLAQARANAAKVRPAPNMPGGPKILPKLVARPYGGELYNAQAASGRFLCTVGYNALSSTGAQYVLSAGHCALNTPPVSGSFFYPDGSFTLIGNTGHRSTMDTVAGDFAAIRANKIVGPLYRVLRQPLSGALLNPTHADNPVRFEDETSWGGNSRRTYHGFISFVDQCANLTNPQNETGPLVHVCNLSINQIDIRAEGCPIGGDSGSPQTTQSPTAGLLATGLVVAVASDEVNCWVYSTQLANAMNAFGLHSAPLP